MEPWQQKAREWIVENYEQFKHEGSPSARAVSLFTEAVAADVAAELRARGLAGDSAETFAMGRSAKLFEIANLAAAEVHLAVGEDRPVNVSLLRNLCTAFTEGPHDALITAAMVQCVKLLDQPSQVEALRGTIELARRFRLER